MFTLFMVIIVVVIMWCYMEYKSMRDSLYSFIIAIKLHGHPDVEVVDASKSGFSVKYGGRIRFRCTVEHNKRLLRRLELSNVGVTYA